jgi:hypothetical protein
MLILAHQSKYFILNWTLDKKKAKGSHEVFFMSLVQSPKKSYGKPLILVIMFWTLNRAVCKKKPNLGYKNKNTWSYL